MSIQDDNAVTYNESTFSFGMFIADKFKVVLVFQLLYQSIPIGIIKHSY